MKNTFLKLYFRGLIAVPIVLLLLPSSFFDSGQSVCLSVLFFDTTCNGCGITRAVHHFLHFEFAEAYAYNKLVVIVLPALIYGWQDELRKTYKKIKRMTDTKKED